MSEVSFAHHGRGPLVEGFDLSVEPGQVCVLEGPSGGGKSTLLRLACGLIPRVQGGRIAGETTVDGRDVRSLPAGEVPRRIGWVPQDPETSFTARTVQRELTGQARNLGSHRPREAAVDALEAFAAAGLLDREVETLSGGQAQRVALAAGWMGQPDVLVLDEPSAQLDREGEHLVAQRVREASQRGQAVLLAAHPPHPFEDVADRVVSVGDERASSPAPSVPEPGDQRRVALVEDAVHAYDDGPRVGPMGLEVRRGEIVHVAGANGAGKTTLLHLLAGLLDPHEGRVRVRGEGPGDLGAGELAQRVGIAFQHPAWHITQDTVREEVAFTSEQLGQPVEADRWLEALGLRALADEHPWDLSGGERQRLAVASACVHEPDVLLLDEPTRGLDGASRDRLARLVADRSEQGLATVVASHHPWMREIAHRSVDVGGRSA